MLKVKLSFTNFCIKKSIFRSIFMVQQFLKEIVCRQFGILNILIL